MSVGNNGKTSLESLGDSFLTSFPDVIMYSNDSVDFNSLAKNNMWNEGTRKFEHKLN